MIRVRKKTKHKVIFNFFASHKEERKKENDSHSPKNRSMQKEKID